MFSLDFKKILPEREKIGIRLANISRAAIHFGVWVFISGVVSLNVGLSPFDAYIQGCVIAFAMTLFLSQAGHDHAYDGDNPALSGDESMLKRHVRFNHAALQWGSMYALFMVPALIDWAIELLAYLFVNYLAAPWGL